MLQGQKSFFSCRGRKMERASGAEDKEQSVKIFLGLLDALCGMCFAGMGRKGRNRWI